MPLMRKYILTLKVYSAKLLILATTIIRSQGWSLENSGLSTMSSAGVWNISVEALIKQEFCWPMSIFEDIQHPEYL